MVERESAKFCIGRSYFMKEINGREMLHVDTPRWGGMKYWPQTLPTPDLTNISRVESRRLYRQALKREKKITDSSQNPTEA